eukprot:5663270-Pyramimonas_sp.AAC.1
MFLRRGNFQADQAAKAGPLLHDSAGQNLVEALHKLTLIARTVCKMAAALLFEWAKLDLSGVELCPPVG